MTGCSAFDSGVRNSLRGAVRPALFLVREATPAYAAARSAPDPAPAPAPDPAPAPAGALAPSGERADALLALGDRIADLARSIQVAEAEMMRLIVEFDRRRGWAEAGFGSCAEWLAWRIGVLPNAARERVRTARALAELPLATAAMAEGRLPYAKARALTRVATPESEEALLSLAEAGSAQKLERVVRAWKAMDDARELSAEQVRHRSRRFSVFVDDDGSYVVKGRLEPEVGAVLMRAVEAAGDALYRREASRDSVASAPVANTPAPPADTPDVVETTAAQRRADAVGLLAERALAAGFGESGGGIEADGVGRGSRAERYQVLLHVEPDTLRADRPSGRSELDGVRVCRETSRRLTCDAGVARVEETRVDGAAPHVTAVTSVGRRTRTVPPALRRALLARDRGCRFPGCGSRFTEAHHIVHWADGGPTELSNLVLLCRRHHRAVHENGMRVCLDRVGTLVFFTASGRAMAGAPLAGAPLTGTPLAGTRSAGTAPPVASPPPSPLLPPPPSTSAYPGAARFTRDRDIPWAVEARAWEALDTG